MLSKVKGNIFSTKAPVIINPVNTKGVAGAGLALEFKLRIPTNDERYREACKRDLLHVGGIFPVTIGQKKVLNAATKGHWKDKTNPVWVSHILGKLARQEYPHIAMPYLGAGLGGLTEQVVAHLVDEIFHDHPTQVELWQFDRNAPCPLYTDFLKLYSMNRAKGTERAWIAKGLNLAGHEDTVIDFAENPTGSIYHLMDRLPDTLKNNLYILSRF